MKSSDREVLDRFAQIVNDYDITSSYAYDNLKIENKPSRTTVSKICGSWAKSIEAIHQIQQNADIRILQRQVEDLVRQLRTPSLNLVGDEISFGIISDTHLGSMYCDLGLLEIAYDTFDSRGIEIVLHAGDLLDGHKIYRGQEFELIRVGADAQVDYCVEHYPYREKIRTMFIDGNHDRSFWKSAGNNTGRKISAQRKDLEYLGHMEADITLGDPESNNKAVVRLFHGEDRSCFAVSYRPQRYLSELANQDRPDMLIMGHYHKAEMLYYRNVLCIQAGCMQRQTPFMRGRRISASLGFWIVHLTVNERGIARILPEFFPVDS